MVIELIILMTSCIFERSESLYVERVRGMYVEGVKELSLYVEGVELMASGSSDDCMAVTLLHGSRTERSYAQGFHSVSATRTCVCRATGLDQPTDTIGGCGGGTIIPTRIPYLHVEWQTILQQQKQASILKRKNI